MKKAKGAPAAAGMAVVLLLLLSITQPALAASSGDALYNELEQYVDLYNDKADDIPFLKWLASKERINCVVYLDGTTTNTMIIGIETDKHAKVVEFKRGAIENPTMWAYTYDHIIYQIIYSESPLQEFVKLLNLNWVLLSGEGYFNRAQVKAIKAVTKSYEKAHGVMQKMKAQ